VPQASTHRSLKLGTLAILALVCVALLRAGSAAAAEPVWLCKPGIPDNPCDTSLKTTLVSPSGQTLGVRNVQPARHPRFDCFYVYPTVSDQPTGNANLNVDPEERSIALYQAARYSRACRVFAPIYRQVTLRGILGLQPGSFDLAYSDVLAAWNTYLQQYNHGRGVVLIGHSQGSAMLLRLAREQIDPSAAERRLLVSAVLLGEPTPLGPINVPLGQDVGGSFQNIRVCHSALQIGCVIGFSTFNAAPPANAGFGRTTTPGMQALCTNPARLAGGPAPLATIFPTTPFAPGSTIGAVTGAVGFTLPAVQTPWIETFAYVGQCRSINGVNALQISGLPGAPVLHPIPDATWGLHLVDANIALGNLVATTAVQGFVWNLLHHRFHRHGFG
jgi:pimeloyl-ACP methyl ester carboxylesterase